MMKGGEVPENMKVIDYHNNLLDDLQSILINLSSVMPDVFWRRRAFFMLMVSSTTAAL